MIGLKMAGHFTILSLVAFCLSSVVIVEAEKASAEILIKQKMVCQLLWHTDQPEMVPELYDTGIAYKIEEHLGDYGHQVYVKEFLDIYKRGMLPRGEIFSIAYPTHLDQAIALFRVFYYSNNFNTLYTTAAWARIHVNEGLFMYAFSVAVVHHPETQRVRVPAYHELNPYLYFENEVMRQAYNAKTSTDPTKPPLDDTIIIQANHSHLHFRESDDTVRYYTEDIALNDVPYYFHLGHPFWMADGEYGRLSSRRGEVFLWWSKLQLARYKMERLANNLGEIEDFDWNYPIPYGFNPSLSYHNGISVPHREAYTNIPSYNYKWLKVLRDCEYRISAAIDMGYAVAKNGTFIPIRDEAGIFALGNLVEGNADSINFDVYGSYDRASRSVLGFSPEPLNAYKVLPSLMQQYGLDQRDPIYWSMRNKIVDYYKQFVSKLPRYTSEELAFPGVKVQSVVVDRVTTFFTPYDYLISGGMKLYNANDKTAIKARQYRLNHKPYNYTISIHSEKDAKGTIRIFLGPKYDVHGEEMDITTNWINFMAVNEWQIDLKAGENVFTRSGTDSRFAVPDEVSGDIFYEKILSAIAGNETYDIPNSLYDYPERMIIPKGSKEGFPLQLFVFVSPYNDEEFYHTKSPIFGSRDVVDKPLGYPLDRPVSSNFSNSLPNAYFQDFQVYHVEESEINKTS